jgi:hypothetical protein
MTKRHNHYEAAFEAFLRAQRVAYVAVDEARRSWHGERSLKNIDFLVTPPAAEERWLVDVKGRHFPSGQKKQYWRNWTTADELRSLGHWEELLGERFEAILLFAYLVRGDVAPLPAGDLFPFRGQWYAFLAVRLEHYLAQARQLSPKWDTWSIPAPRFRSLARSVAALWQCGGMRTSGGRQYRETGTLGRFPQGATPPIVLPPESSRVTCLAAEVLPFPPTTPDSSEGSAGP